MSLQHGFWLLTKYQKTNFIFAPTLIVGYVLFSGVLLTPGMLPADLPSHSYRNLIALLAGCSIISTVGKGRLRLQLVLLILLLCSICWCCCWDWGKNWSWWCGSCWGYCCCWWWLWFCAISMGEGRLTWGGAATIEFIASGSVVSIASTKIWSTWICSIQYFASINS